MAAQKTPRQTGNRKTSTRGKAAPRRSRPAAGGVRVTVGRNLNCADFVGRDKTTITYNYAPAHLEKLIQKVLEFLEAGAVFLPTGPQRDAYRAELNGEALTFQPGAVQQLISGRRRTERSYLLGLTLEQRYSRWATEFVPLQANVDIRREDLDLPLPYTLTEPPPPGSGPEAQARSESIEDITEALHKHDAFVVLGAPGAGKTTTLRKIAFEAARTQLKGAPGRLPLPVLLSQQHAKTPFEFLEAEWRHYTGADFADALAEGRVLVLADGLNELPRDPDVRAERLKDWRVFVEQHAHSNQFVFTSRASGEYAGQLNLPNVRVEPLDPARIADYLRRRQAEGLASYLNDPRRRLLDLARNPFYLWMMTQVYRSDASQLANRGRLVRQFTGVLLKREADLAHRGWDTTAPILVPALSRLAFAMQDTGASLTIDLKTARTLTPATVEVDDEVCKVDSAELFRLARAATLLDPGQTRTSVRFYHQLIQEYFAARELLRRFDSAEDLGRLWRAKRSVEEMPPASVGEWDALPEPPGTGWEETTILACGLAPDPAVFVETVRAHYPHLAARCWREAGVEWPEAAQAEQKPKLQQDLSADLYDPQVHLRARLQAGYTLGRIGDPRFAPQVINDVKVIVPTLIPVPAGTYLIGSRADDPEALSQEKPQHTVELPAFSLGKWPVTNAEYACFMDAGGYKDEQWWATDLAKRWLKGEDVMGGQASGLRMVWDFIRSTKDWREQMTSWGSISPSEIEAYAVFETLADEAAFKAWVTKSVAGKSRERPQWWNDSDRNNPSQPVVGVTWFEANAYCAWLSAVTGHAYRLPTEAEWEAAVRGRLPSPSQGEGLGMGVGARIYPWGNDWDSARANTIEGRVLKPSPVGAYTAAGNVGPFGGEDQAGNVWNWTSSLYRDYRYKPEDGREDPQAEGERVVRGGSWDDDRRNARCAFRSGYVPGDFNFVVGFRVLSPVLS